MDFPCRDFPSHEFDVRDAPVEALAAERAEFNLGNVEPTAMFGRVMDFKATSQPPRFLRRKGLVK